MAPLLQRGPLHRSLDRPPDRPRFPTTSSRPTGSRRSRMPRSRRSPPDQLETYTRPAATVMFSHCYIKSAAEAPAMLDCRGAAVQLAVERHYLRPEVDETRCLRHRRWTPSGGGAGTGAGRSSCFVATIAHPSLSQRCEDGMDRICLPTGPEMAGEFQSSRRSDRVSIAALVEMG